MQNLMKRFWMLTITLAIVAGHAVSWNVAAGNNELYHDCDDDLTWANHRATIFGICDDVDGYLLLADNDFLDALDDDNTAADYLQDGQTAYNAGNYVAAESNWNLAKTYWEGAEQHAEFAYDDIEDADYELGTGQYLYAQYLAVENMP